MPALNRQGLRKLSADLIDKASDETAAQVVRIMLAFVGTAAFCLLSLASPDSGLLTSDQKLNVPGAGPVSFFGFMLLGPAVLIVLRIYLQIYVEHSDRLDRVAQRMPVARAPTLAPFKNPLIRVFSGFTFYLLLPVTMLLFAWKAGVFPIWGSGLLFVAAGVIAIHAMLPLRRISWRTRALLSMGVAILAGGVIYGFGPPRRAFELSHANLSGAWLRDDDLLDAHLSSANLSGADLSNAHLDNAHLNSANLSGANLSNAHLGHAHLSSASLSGANLSLANLSNADLDQANLSGAHLRDANLGHAHLNSADLSGADLSSADLSGADLIAANNVDQQQLDAACGTDAKLPQGLTLKLSCPPFLKLLR
jgi:uncharacterized protein YjbI with pentapeptide repeats